MRLFNRKPKFVYEFSGGDSFHEKEIVDPHELVKHMIDEDNRFRRDYLEGSITVSKVKNDKNGKIYYAEQFDLPQDEGFDWLAALSSFFVKKPQEYDFSLLSSENEENPLNPDKETTETTLETNKSLTLEDFEATLQSDSSTQNDELSAVPSEKQAHEEPVSTIQSEVATSVEDEAEVVQLTKNDYEALRSAIQEQKKETERLREKISQKETPSVKPEPIPVIPIEKEAPSVIENLFVQETEPPNVFVPDELVPGVLRSTQTEIDQVLSQFIQTETTKIDEEIQQLDKRDQISGIISERLQLEEKEQLNQLSQQQATKKDQLLQEENQRHQQKVQEIERSCEEECQNKAAEIRSIFEEKITTSIKEEYDKQTDQLVRVFQGKMEELQLRQQAMNDGLGTILRESLEKFNQQHNQVIQEVERKKQGSPINLEEQRKLKQA
ncbi:hypothetical protein [Candidatus Enterococcus ikei]|uniref:Uncharacterized protein n=1 Tax=Candidatus Enterococcus ikei TaxID=2815326 RepID=A0ABS3H3C9_9ENTE|nr:hypothetical protein [Enterococcus sp. DIV0869a]MBO0441545.1 hypothetical protein [Enterococcus sp. DIV0869a]